MGGRVSLTFALIRTMNFAVLESLDPVDLVPYFVTTTGLKNTKYNAQYGTVDYQSNYRVAKGRIAVKFQDPSLGTKAIQLKNLKPQQMFGLHGDVRGDSVHVKMIPEMDIVITKHDFE